MTTPISIITTPYNQERYLGSAIESVLAAALKRRKLADFLELKLQIQQVRQKFHSLVCLKPKKNLLLSASGKPAHTLAALSLFGAVGVTLSMLAVEGHAQDQLDCQMLALPGVKIFCPLGGPPREVIVINTKVPDGDLHDLQPCTCNTTFVECGPGANEKDPCPSGDNLKAVPTAFMFIKEDRATMCSTIGTLRKCWKERPSP